MKSPEMIRDILASQPNNHKLFIFSAEKCRWCQILKEKLSDQVLQIFCQKQGIHMEWISLHPKKEDEAKALITGIPTTRETYEVKSLPTAVFLDPQGKTIESTEFIDTCQTEGGRVYVTWLETLILNNRK